ncbi:MAG: hypothetical protein KGL11_15345 [Alphaproteobacteria bacterium]|nr:hypothetical protein [Alphaproteobacteria bacterium]
MRGLLIAGIVLIVLGIAGLAVNVVPIRHQEQVAKIGSLTINSEKETDYVIPNYVGIIAIVAGVALVVAGTRRS